MEGIPAHPGQHDLDTLEIRFDAVPPGLREKIGAIEDEEKLRTLLCASIQCASMEEFAAQL